MPCTRQVSRFVCARRVTDRAHSPRDFHMTEAAVTTPGVAAAAKAAEPIACSVSDGFVAWMPQAGGSLAVTTYQAGKVALIGWDERLGQTTLLMRQFDKPMGLAATPDGRRLALATREAVLLLADAPLLAHDYLEE